MAEKKVMNFAQALRLKPGSLRENAELLHEEAVEQSLSEPIPYPTHTVPVPDSNRTITAPNPNPTLAAPKSVAPARDFNRRANSLERDALPARLFPGASKKIYDALYLRTRGAIVPTRTIKARRRELRDWAGVSDIKTIDVHLRKLEAAGLIARSRFSGEHEGSIYEVFMPEEVDLNRTLSVTAPNPNLKTESYRTQKTDRVGLGNTIENTTTYNESKTSFKTKEENLDDECAHSFMKAMRKVEIELTGKTSVNAEKWGELAELLATELKIAAARTTVSDVPAFLTEHLRRRLWKVDKTKAAEIAVEPEQGSSPALNDEERRKCPDCAGTNFWYPGGPEKGVARCSHKKLLAK